MQEGTNIFKYIDRTTLQSLINIGPQAVLINSRYDSGISQSYTKAIEMAAQHLLQLDQNQINLLFNELFVVFEMWRDNFGLYPPLLGAGIRNISERKRKQLPAAIYIQQLKSEYNKEEIIKIPAPWECCDLAYTPVSFFLFLFREEFIPLIQLIKKQENGFSYGLAVSIIMTHLTEKLSTDCIYGALELSACNTLHLSDVIRSMETEKSTSLNRKIGRAKTASQQKERTLEKVLEIYNKHSNKKSLKWMACEARISESTMSKYLKESGIDYKKDKKKIS